MRHETLPTGSAGDDLMETEALLAQLTPDDPEYGWLQEKQEEEASEDLTHEVDPEEPELRTQAFYGVQKESELQKDIDAMAEKIRRSHETQSDRQAS